jgi:hypothetical protein
MCCCVWVVAVCVGVLVVVVLGGGGWVGWVGWGGWCLPHTTNPHPHPHPIPSISQPAITRQSITTTHGYLIGDDVSTHTNTITITPPSQTYIIIFLKRPKFFPPFSFLLFSSLLFSSTPLLLLLSSFPSLSF